MKKKECAIVMAYTGVCMLSGKNFSLFHKYIEEILQRPIYTHQLGMPKIQDEIKEKSYDDFIKLCQTAED